MSELISGVDIYVYAYHCLRGFLLYILSVPFMFIRTDIWLGWICFKLGGKSLQVHKW